MRIGIDASRAFLKQRTGIEEYSYRVIQHLRDELPNSRVTLYVQAKLVFQRWRVRLILPEIDFSIPATWRVKGLWAPRFWTQVRLSLEMLFSPVDTLFVPAHTVPLVHPRRTIVTIHGLEYEYAPESYSLLARWYMRVSIRYSVRMAQRIIAVSENTKRDLIRLYHVPEERIRVVYEGVTETDFTETRPSDGPRLEVERPYFFFVGRLEARKNISRMIQAFKIFKEKTGLPHDLVLAGKPGYGYEEIRQNIARSKFRDDIRELGYVTEAEKWEYLRRAEAFLFPTLYEGFGLPVLEAQSVGVPVITSNTSSLPEIAGAGAMLVDPMDGEALAEAMETVVRNPERWAGIIEKATHNVNRFSWVRCAREVAKVLER